MDHERAEKLQSGTNEAIRKALRDGDLDRAFGIMHGMCKLPDKVEDLIKFIAKPYCSYSSDYMDETLKRQVDELEKLQEWLPVIDQAIREQIRRRRHQLRYLKGEETETEVTP